MRAMALLALPLAACGSEMTAGEATDAANAQLIRELPQVSDVLDDLDVRTQDLGEKWRVTYAAYGSGRVFIDVDKRDGEAVIVHMEQ